MKPALIAVILALLNGCMNMSAALTPPQSQYDAVIVNPVDGKGMTIDELAERLMKTDVVIIGEYHGHHGSHLLQSRLQQALHRQRPPQVLSMEQFDANHQKDLNRYLAGKIGETELIEDSEAWDNYRASYRPLVEYARLNQQPVIAANAPARVVRCVGRKGPDYLDQLSQELQQLLPDEPFMDTASYREKFVDTITGSHGTGTDAMSERMSNSYQAQLLRDNTMASRILEATQTYPDHQIVHLTGTFHSEERLGTVALLQKRAPRLSIAVISPVFRDDEDLPKLIHDNRHKGDFLYLIQPLPVEFVDEERGQRAMMERFRRSSSKPCD